MIQFLLNQELKTEHALDPNMTVLNYLREHLHRSGTKEGCASGDCGACTVVVGELSVDANGDDQLSYRSLNSCLTFVASLHGKQLISVEDLKHQGRLHGVQKAMVDCHGSQCGFCTPGFVMSLFALQKNSDEADSSKIKHAQAHEALAGNLCRCTGYRPILAAAEQACSQHEPDQFDHREPQTIARLKAIAPKETAELNSGDKRCLVPLTVTDLAELYDAYPQARLLAGGTDLALEVTQFHRPLPVMLYVGHIADMKKIEYLDDRIEIGAATSLTDCYEALSGEYPDFGELLHRFASLQIRNQGTLGGNIGNASPIGDSPPLLIALGASIVLRKGHATPLVLVTNDFTRTAEEIAGLYKDRWKIELFFKWIKQHLKLKRFYAFSENAVRLQIYSALISYLLLHLYRRRSGFGGSLFELTLRIVHVLHERPMIPKMRDQRRQKLEKLKAAQGSLQL